MLTHVEFRRVNPVKICPSRPNQNSTESVLAKILPNLIMSVSTTQVLKISILISFIEKHILNFELDPNI